MSQLGETRDNRSTLVVPVSILKSYYRRPAFYDYWPTIEAIYDSICIKGYFLNRHVAEKDSSLVQIVAYGIVRHGRQLLCMQRSGESNRPPLRFKRTVLFGGHVDDIHSTQPIESCIARELEEELGISALSRKPQLLGIAADPTTAVGRQHLGVVFDIEHQTNFIQVTSAQDTAEFAISGEITRHQFFNYNELKELKGKFDPWSQLFLASESATRILGAPKPRV